ncbi:MAG: metallophosphoesterase family protein [Thermoguttaceae bacterium]
MSQRPFRFIHTGEFHLEKTIGGVSEVPDHLRELFFEARYTAAKRVFDAALMEDAAFVVLSGDILHPLRAGPRALLFLREQFIRLAEREISVYFSGGETDPPESWPGGINLPENVHLFPQARVDEYIHDRQGVAIARLLGTSHDKQRTIRAGDFHPDPSGLTTIAAAYGAAELSAMQSRGIHYWALGGRHQRATLCSTRQIIHYCGSPQGGRPEETGIHGCTLVQVDENQQIQTSLIPTDALRWLDERIEVDQQTDKNDLKILLAERMRSLREASPQQPLLIAWTIAGDGLLLKHMQRNRLAADLLDWLRNEFGFASPAAWSLMFRFEAKNSLPSEWYEQETIRGDFLRDIRRLQMNPQQPLELDAYVSEEHKSQISGAERGFRGDVARDQTLNEAAFLGAALLSGEVEESAEVEA